MEIEKLIEKLRDAGWTNPGLTDKQSLEWDAATALEQLQAENGRLQAELEKEEAARKKQADILYELRGQKHEQTTAIDQLRAENDRFRRERDEAVIDMTALMAGQCCDLCAVEYCNVRGKTEMCATFKWRGPKEEFG